MAKKKAEPKIELEREYIVPLRKEWLKVPKHKRANKAVKALKQFIAKHMKVYDKDLRKIKVEQILNNEIRFKGMKKPPSRIKVKAKKYDNDIVKVELVDIPAHIKFAQLREEKKKSELKKKVKEKPVEKPEEPKEGEEGKEVKTEETEEAKEKKEASKEEGLAKAKMQAKEQKHTSKAKQVQVHRKALSR
jgi:large subunit ribosomal protein L31e